MLMQGQVGPQIGADGAMPSARLGKLGDVIMSELHGRYYEQGYRGNMFIASTQAAVTFAAGLSATSVFGLRNPALSGKNLIINSVQLAFSAPPAAATVILYAANINTVAAAPSAVTALTVQPAILGTTASAVGIPFSAATLASVPVVVRVGPSIVAAASITPPYMNDEIAGQIILAPGAILAVEASAAASAFCSICWEEVAV